MINALLRVNIDYGWLFWHVTSGLLGQCRMPINNY